MTKKGWRKTRGDGVGEWASLVYVMKIGRLINKFVKKNMCVKTVGWSDLKEKIKKNEKYC